MRARDAVAELFANDAYFFQFDNLGINVGYTSSIKFIARMATVIESLTNKKHTPKLPSGKCTCVYRKTFDKIRYQSAYGHVIASVRRWNEYRPSNGLQGHIINQVWCAKTRVVP